MSAASMPGPLTVRVEGRRALLYDRRDHQYRRLRRDEAFLLVASRDVGVEGALAQLARVADPDRVRDVAELAWQSDWLDDEGVLRGRVVELEPVEGAWASPLVVHVGVTLACNFSCAHCYSSSGRRAPDELSLDEITGIVEQMAEMGAMKLVLGGGEPFVRKDLAAIVRAADARGVDCFVHTNASLITAGELRALAAHPPAGLSVSLDGPDAATNDRVRGAGAFDKALAGVVELSRSYPPGFNVSFTVTATNADAAPRMVELAHQVGARVLLLRPSYPAGVALSSPELWCDRDTFARAVDLAEPRARELGVTLDAPHPKRSAPPDFEGFGCVAGRVVLGVSPTGRVTPCLNLPERFFTGDVRTGSLSALWRADGAHAELRAQAPGELCSTCRHYDTCRGGCRVRALAADRGVGGPDSWCHHEPRDGVTPAPRRVRSASVSRSLPVVP